MDWLRSACVLTALALAGYALPGCGAAPAPAPGDSAAVAADHDHGDDHDHDHDHEGEEAHSHEGEDGHSHEGEDGHHHHEAPHGGALVSLGDHVGHLEFVLDKESGLLTAYVLDGEAENPVRIPDPSFEVAIDVDGANPFVATLNAVENALAGETVGDTSEFNATLEGLVGVESFKGVVASVTFKGVAMTNIAFNYPEGEQ